uniref:ATP synthase CF0 subunit II n=1 Tax=Balbiania investiens TaxID=111861 RepID=A0A4D6BL31_9FLOR|nr:ATP synthase CF0 subunit II [Balbiania investiens]QBX88666.1 ATP synthase CF0 subunit II [Balbiania investiens]
MINLPVLLALNISAAEVDGGLFDFNATLPLMALQFLVLMSLLNITFFKPVTKILDDRDEYIRNSLTTASATLQEADLLTRQYEQELAEARRDAQKLIKSSQKEAEKIVLSKIKEAQNDAEQLVYEASQQLVLQKDQAIKTLESQVQILSDQIKAKLLNNQSTN